MLRSEQPLKHPGINQAKAAYHPQRGDGMRIAELRYKEIINVCNGHRLGFVCDVDMDVNTGRVCALIVPGPCRFFGLFGREDDYILPFDCISKIGEDIILVEVKGEYRRGKCGKRSGY